MQKKAIRAITNSDYNANTNVLFKALHVLKLTDIYKLYLGKFMFSQLHSTLTTPLLIGNDVLNHNVHQYETRNQHRPHIEYARTKTLQDSFLVGGPQL